VTSEKDKGSDFWFEIPLVAEPSSSGTIFDSIEPNGKTVAIAYRPSLTRDCIEYYLNQRGHVVRQLDGQLELSSIDVLLMEYTQDCNAVTKRLRSALPNIPIVFLYQLGTHTFSTEVGKSLHSPIKPEQLFQYVEQEQGTEDKREIKSKILPIAQAGQATDNPAVCENETATPSARVLVAEDNLVNQKVITNILAKQGFEIVVVMDGQEAVEKTLSQKFDLILMDWQMPVMDGIEATLKIREFDSHIPIIFITAAANKRDECLEAGANGFITKPFKPSQLREVMAKYTLKGQTESVPL